MRNLFFTAFFLFAIWPGQDTFAQSKYKQLDKNEGVTFLYKWKPSRCLNKNSPLVLVLKIENSNDYSVNTEFVVDYFWEAIRKASSPRQSFCIKAGKKKRGRMGKLGFDRGQFSNDDILSDKFILELSEIAVTEVDRCRK